MNIEYIAKEAGVSKSAVSFALNGKPGISQETRERILAIAKQYGYTPKSKAAAEAPNKSLTFLVLANSGIVLEQYYQQPFFRELIQYIEERCRSHGYSLIFSTVDMENFERNIRIATEEKRSDGAILLGTNLGAEQVSAIAEKIGSRLVVLDTYFETLPLHFVGINNFMGAYQAGTHLCELGHDSFGYIASNVRIPNFEERKRGFLEALSENDRSIAQDAFFSVSPTMLSSQDELKAQLNRYLENGRTLPSALFCECDYIAISAMKTLAELGIRVPEDVSVVGFDNITEAVIISPELTTIHVEKERLAAIAVDLLVESIEDGLEVKNKIKVDTQLVKRKSASCR
ncbi:LacI family DNA-binding transcriptional regulator [Paenibacillus harenae]|uniref:LacI family DNA-binding transcriptional regulator n=1 Tax=Paenibacillus harenae TaxID=306543 RepID=UPI0003F9D08C|nr:LacI family DNA-binding transcriptional regulator [Paenibacillus harenae]